MKKRIKSGLITLISILGVVVVSPQFVDFSKFASEKLSDWGVPVVVVGVAGVLLSEVWKQILNWRMLSKNDSLAGGFSDYSNELY